MDLAPEIGPKQDVTWQTMRDRVEADKRLSNCADRYAEMDGRLKPYPKASLLSAAAVMCKQRQIPLPDRICCRGRKPLICFFCENFPDFPLGFTFLANASPAIPAKTQDRGIDVMNAQRKGFAEAGVDLVGVLHPKADDPLDWDIFTSQGMGFSDSWFTFD
jgi:hypothetical protein